MQEDIQLYMNGSKKQPESKQQGELNLNIRKAENRYSEVDVKQFSNLLKQFKQIQTEKKVSSKDLLVEHKKLLLDIFSKGATVQELLQFLKENEFKGISAQTLKSFLDEHVSH